MANMIRRALKSTFVGFVAVTCIFVVFAIGNLVGLLEIDTLTAHQVYLVAGFAILSAAFGLTSKGRHFAGRLLAAMAREAERPYK
ncbi:MAG: hypothetical protein AAF950_13170 [Pseudomonadota bacterium]